MRKEVSMAKPKKHKKAPVYRITVDELMSDEYARILIAPISDDVKREQTFLDQHEIWGEEWEQYVDRKSWPRHARNLGISPGLLPWKDLRESWVYLVGQFETIGATPKITGFRLRPGGKPNAQRLDNIEAVKTEIKTMYSRLLKR
jgi:hypothetical protein